MNNLQHATHRGNELSLDRWFALLLIEPCLAELARRASCGGAPADWIKLTERLARLTGPSARRERLRGVSAYQTAAAYLRLLFVRAGGVA